MAQVNAGRVRFVAKGEYNNATQYYTFDLVNYNGNSYYAKENTIGNLPTDTTKWQLVAEKGNVGPTGPTGATGNGIASITKTSTSGLVDTYTITYTNGTTTTYQVTNGEDGEVTQAQLDEVQEELDRYKMLENALPKVTGEGTELTLNDTANAPMKTIPMASELEQASTTGKNLLNTEIQSRTTNGVTITKNKDGSITLNGTATADFGIYKTINLVLPAGVYKFSIGETEQPSSMPSKIFISLDSISSTQISSNTYTERTITLNEEKTYSQFIIWLDNGCVLNNFTIYPMISIDGRPYEKFTGGNPAPSPEFPMQIHTISGNNKIIVGNKNLLDLSKFELGYYLNGNYEKTANGQNALSDYIIVKPNNDYKTSGTYFGIGVCLYDKNKNPLYRNGSLEATNKFTTTNETYYARIFIRASNTQNVTMDLLKSKNPQLELGSTATSYVPHEEQEYELNLPVENLISSLSKNGNTIYFNDVTSADNYIFNAGTYTLSYKNNNTVNAYYKTENGSQINLGTDKSITFTANENFNIWFWRSGITLEEFSEVQLEPGTKANSYTPYGTQPLEVCKIGDYEDEFVYNETDTTLELNKWYLKKNIGKVVLDGSESNYFYSASYQALGYTNNKIANIPTGKITVMSNKAIGITVGSLSNNNGIAQNISNNRILVKFDGSSIYNTSELVKEYFSNNNYLVYFLLATPEYILCSDTLQTQLNNIQKVLAYQEQTNVSQVNNDLPFTLKLSAIRDMSNIFELIQDTEL